MRRPVIALLSTMLLTSALAGASVVSAHQGETHGPSLKAYASDARPGGELRVGAGVRHADPTVLFSASAVVHLASGDVPVVLDPTCLGWGDKKPHAVPAHHSSDSPSASDCARGSITVPTTEVEGPITVDVTIVYGALTQTITVESRIKASHHRGDCGHSDRHVDHGDHHQPCPVPPEPPV